LLPLQYILKKDFYAYKRKDNRENVFPLIIETSWLLNSLMENNIMILIKKQ